MFTTLAFALVLAAQPPLTVNGAVLGTEEEFRRAGPASICLMTTRFRLQQGESSELGYLGIHNGSIRINTNRGELSISEGDNWATPKHGVKVYDTDTGFIERVGSGEHARYLFFAPTKYSKRPRARVWVSGPAIVGNDVDIELLDRIEVSKIPFKDCDQSFHYGWDFILGDQDP